MSNDPVGDFLAKHNMYPGQYMIDIANNAEFRRAVFGGMSDYEIHCLLQAFLKRELTPAQQQEWNYALRKSKELRDNVP